MAKQKVAVVGAGVMGLWSALNLSEMGHEVVLVDAWGAGHPRSTSGDETRVIRCGYGGSRFYAGWAKRSLAIWKSRQRAWGERLLHETGVLWMVAGEEAYARECARDLDAVRMPYVRLAPAALAARFPQINPRGLRWALLEAKAGAILSRGACRALLAAFLRAGGRFRLARVPAPGAGMSEGARGRRLSRLDCTDGRPLRADQYLFACGPWLPGLFPALLGRRIAVTRKDVYYFGTPAGETRFDGSELPVWMELGTLCYGIPSLAGLGFKVNPDLPGARVEPSSLERQPSRRVLNAARACLARRFPAMSAAPLLGARVCQYESTADDHMIFDRHPGYDNVWLAGGGSGHCFKHGPAIGELVASALTARSTDRIPEPLRLSHVARGRHF